MATLPLDHGPLLVGNPGLESIDVTNRGLVGDGATNNVAAWNAMKTLEGDGKDFVFPPGDYLFSGATPCDVNAGDIIRGVGGWESVNLIADGCTNGVFRNKASDAGNVDRRIVMEQLNFSTQNARSNYILRMIEAQGMEMRRIKIFNHLVGDDSAIIDAQMSFIDCWNLLLDRVTIIGTLPVGEATTAAIKLDGECNAVSIRNLETSDFSHYGVHVCTDEASGGFPADVSVSTGDGSAIQGHEIGVYLQRCRSASVKSYFEATKTPIRCGSNDSSSDRCASPLILGGLMNTLDSAFHGASTTGHIELIRADAPFITGVTFNDYLGSAVAGQYALWIQRCYNGSASGMAGNNAATKDMYPAIGFSSADANNYLRWIGACGKSLKGDVVVYGGSKRRELVASSIPTAGNDGDIAHNTNISAGGTTGWARVSGVWKTTGSVQA